MLNIIYIIVIYILGTSGLEFYSIYYIQFSILIKDCLSFIEYVNTIPEAPL